MSRTERAENHYIAAGQHLKTLKAQHDGTWMQWEALLKERVGIGKSRASELMQIADGTKTVSGVRAETAERTRLTRERKEISPLRSGETTVSVRASPKEAPDCPRCGNKMRLETTVITTTFSELTGAVAALLERGIDLGLVSPEQVEEMIAADLVERK